jgi:3-oxoacyl-[acyl-carrier protein] reductase
VSGAPARTALVSGVSRRDGIGFAVARRLGAAGADLLVQSWAPHDTEQGLADPDGTEAVIAELRAALPGRRVEHAALDFADSAAPAACVDAAVAAFGRVDVLVANHARSSNQALGALTATELDLALAVNVRATLLLVQAYAAQAPEGGRVILMTSGQYHDVQPRELPYIAGKGAIHQLTRTLAAELAPRGITLNTVDPGPTDTGWMTPAIRAAVLPTMAMGRLGEPEDAARLIGWLCSPDAGWVTGQVIGSTGGAGLRPLGA